MKKNYILNENDMVEVHLNENGFDLLFVGQFKSMNQDGILIDTKEGAFFIPLQRVLYMKKKHVEAKD
jgi:hypothetical protein